MCDLRVEVKLYRGALGTKKREEGWVGDVG